MRAFVLLIFFGLISNLSISQDFKKDKSQFIDYKNEFMDNIIKSSEKFKKKEEPKKKTFKMDFTDYNLPKSSDEFKTQWHNPPISQGNTGTCWCFSGTSYLESEIYRLNKTRIKISEMYTVYWEYVEKARRFIQERGNSEFGEGSQGNAVIKIWEKYGCVPWKAYNGLLEGQEFHDHSTMFREMNDYLKEIKRSNAWNEEVVISTIKSILNNYLGIPPEKFYYEGAEYTPTEFRDKICKINLDEYIDIISILENPYYTKITYDVPDNWWRCNNYYNVPLDEFMKVLKNSVKDGFTAFIGGDVSEPGYYANVQSAVVPTFDIPSQYIDENARYLRYYNKSTTDDHGIHIVGYKEDKGVYWFLIKDSGSSSFNGINKGYYYYHEDYIKLKMMNFMLHRSTVMELLKKFQR